MNSTHKPVGLWVSDESQRESWSWFCTMEAEWLSLGAYRFSVELDMDRILHLESCMDLLNFTERFRTRYGINWEMVSESWPGILITPYQWSLRLDDRTHWYYGWDVASGCVWDPTAIQVF